MSVTLNYDSSNPIGGYQFRVNGVTLTDVYDTFDILSFNAASGMVFGTSITGMTLPAGTGTLVTMEYEAIDGGSAISISEVVFGDADGNEMAVNGPDASSVPACDNYDNDGICNVYDEDDDNDGVADGDDSHPLNEFECYDLDADTCDDCSSGTVDTSDDGWDYDLDGACDAGDDDDDNDGALDENDSNDNNEFECSDDDSDTCDDCSSGIYTTTDDGWDYDGDGACDTGDNDDDNDGALDENDSDDNNEFVCSDDDSDTCDDCSDGSYGLDSDGADNDEDGICDDGDDDDDNDGVADDDDSDPFDNFVCGDTDSDTCEDCSSGTYNSTDDGWDYDSDGICDAGDDDDDNDGALDDNDSDDNNELECSDNDGDSCDDCSDGSYGLDSDGDDNDGDGWCNTGDAYPDCAYDNANDPSVYPEQINVDPYDECGNCHGDGFADTCVGTDDCADMACDGDCDQVAYIDDCGECDDSTNTDCVELSLDLHSGANLISFYALNGNNSISDIFSGLADNSGVIGEGVGTINIDGNWIGSLTEVSPDAGYWVKVAEASTVLVSGADPVNYDSDGEVSYAVHYGNNLISYSFQTAQYPGDALGDAAANVYAIAGEGVAALNTVDGWMGSLQAFVGGNGYWLVATDDFTFSFSGVTDGLTRAEQSVLRALPETYRYRQSDEQSFYFVQNATIAGEALEADDIVIAYNGDVVVGSRYWNGEYTDIPAIGVDSEDSEIYAGYCKTGDKITFKVLDASTGSLVDMDVEGDVEWTSMGISVINLTETFLPTEVSLGNAYPNPFNPVTMLTYDVPTDMAISLGIYDVRGRLVEELVNDMHDQGRYEITWNADQHSSGVYMIKMTAGTAVKVQKIMLVK